MIGLLGALYVFSVICVMLRWAFFPLKDMTEQPKHLLCLTLVGGAVRLRSGGFA
jgi:hypothetical protein